MSRARKPHFTTPREGAPGDDARPGVGEELSPREEQTLRLIAWGHSNKDIAEQVGVSLKTVETYKRRAMQKLGLKTRVDLVRHAVRSGWLADPA